MAGLFRVNRPSINDSLRDYCTSLAVHDWADKDWAKELHTWSERLNTAFDLDIATPVILIERPRFRGVGCYRRDLNGFGLRHEITINRKRLNEPLAWLLTALLRELLREWQFLHGRPGGRRGYFNHELRAKAIELGLHLDRAGHFGRVCRGPFVELLERHGVDTGVLAKPPIEAPKTSCRPKRWTCGCSDFLATMAVCARCESCGRPFVLARKPANGTTHQDKNAARYSTLVRDNVPETRNGHGDWQEHS